MQRLHARARGVLRAGVFLCSLLAALAAARSAGAAVQEYAVPPQATDPAIDNWLEDHYAAIDPGALQQDRLFVFLPGSYAKPLGSRMILREGAARGVRSIGLRYPNNWMVVDFCGNNAACYEQFRLEVIDGIDRTSTIDISPANAITNRLVKLLQYLDANHPAQGWGQFLAGGEPRWDSIVIAGHSQGGGYANMLGREEAMAGVMLIAAACDRANGQPAPWQAAPRQTPAANYFSFIHKKDTLAFPDPCLNLIGVPGAPVDADVTPPPYNHSNRLTTDRLPQTGSYEQAHLAVVIDLSVPLRTDGTPYYDETWTYMMEGGDPLETPTLSGAASLGFALLLAAASARRLRRNTR
jgi:hypothetical protein